ncbi:multiubiquitin domain-containing protein [Janthinobacterium rivuli]|uniref:multiubiquitin domain-containing protein n=1 Tax=Janthinobacterium rivuli TaxID=2751478 RepID=UPI003839F132
MTNAANNGHNDQPKLVTIVINGKPKAVAKDDLTYADVIVLAFETPPTGDGVQFSITYTKGHKDSPKGTMVEGQSVKAKEGMEFDVTPTNRS